MPCGCRSFQSKYVHDCGEVRRKGIDVRPKKKSENDCSCTVSVSGPLTGTCSSPAQDCLVTARTKADSHCRSKRQAVTIYQVRTSNSIQSRKGKNELWRDWAVTVTHYAQKCQLTNQRTPVINYGQATARRHFQNVGSRREDFTGLFEQASLPLFIKVFVAVRCQLNSTSKRVFQLSGQPGAPSALSVKCCGRYQSAMLTAQIINTI
jgi:hypothetical protein